MRVIVNWLRHPVRPPLALGVVATALLIGTETMLGYPVRGLAPDVTVGMVYLGGILAVATVWGLWLGVANTIASYLAFDFFHLPPYGGPGANLIVTLVFLVLGVAVSLIAELAWRRALAAYERPREAELAADMARLLLHTDDLCSACPELGRRFAETFDLPAAAITLEEVAGDGRWVALPLRRGTTRLGTFLVPAKLPDAAWRRLRIRAVPALEALLGTAREREALNRELKSSRDYLRRLADEQGALRRVSTLVAKGVHPTGVFAAAAAEVRRLFGGESARLFHYDPDGTVTVVASHCEPDIDIPVGTHLTLEGRNVAGDVFRTATIARRNSLEGLPGSLGARQRALGIRSTVGSPIVVDGRLWGVMVAAWTRHEPPADIDCRIADFTELVATAIANADSRTKLVASRARVVAAADEARRRLERDLHDGTQQRLVSMSLDLRAAEAMAPPGHEKLRNQLSHTAQDLAAALEDMHEIARGIHPAILTHGGLKPALKALARRSPIPVELDVRMPGRLHERVEVAAYYVVSEALTNAQKHARASVVHVEADVTGSTLTLVVRDDGKGGANAGSGSGLIGLADRVEALEGRMELMSPCGRGTTLRVTIPVATSLPRRPDA